MHTASKRISTFLCALPLFIACGSSGDKDDGGSTSATGTPTASTSGGSNGSTSGGTTSGSSTSGAANGSSTSGSNASASGSGTDTSGSGGSGGSGGSDSGTDGIGGDAGAATTGLADGFGGGIADGVGGGFNTACEGLTPVNGETCEDSGTICGLDGGGDEVCVCADAGDGLVWSCLSGIIGGVGGGFAQGTTGM
jgi:hypothetical protein